MTTNGPCQVCTSFREAITSCPCGCQRWVCRRCLRSVKRVLNGHVLSAPRKYQNHVVMGDGTRAVLVPGGCLNRIREPDGHASCNHGDSTVCDRQGHETITLYEVVSESAFYGAQEAENSRLLGPDTP